MQAWRRTACGVLVGLGLAGGAAAQAIGEGDGRLVTLQGIRSATVAPAGLGYVALALSERADADTADGLASSLSFGTGFGDAARGVGVQLSASLSPAFGGLGESGSLGLKFGHRLATDTPTFVALSLDRLGGWGERADLAPTATLAITTFPKLRVGADAYPLMLTVGVESELGEEDADPVAYAGGGIGLTRNFGASLAWTGRDWTLGTVARVDGLDNWRFTASISDLLDQEDGRRLSVTATYVIQDLWGGR